MKKIIWAIYCLLIVMQGAGAASTNITVKVVDETGLPLQDVKTTIVFDAQDERKKIEGLTDTNGLFSAQGEIPAKIGIGGEKSGYYRSVDNFYFIPENDSADLEPWGGCTLILRKITEPIEGKSGSTRTSVASWIKIPVFDKPVGFDVLESDWVAPYGKGDTADFIFTFSKDQSQKTLSYVLAFSNKGDGILEYQFDKDNQSLFRWPHKAPLDGYATLMERMTGYDRSDAIIPPEKKTRGNDDINYIFRIRTVFNDDGDIESALYGKITGETVLSTKPKDEVRFSYWLNTDPHSRSLERTDRMLP